jgi:hypothetical protein
LFFARPIRLLSRIVLGGFLAHYASCSLTRRKWQSHLPLPTGRATPAGPAKPFDQTSAQVRRSRLPKGFSSPDSSF